MLLRLWFCVQGPKPLLLSTVTTDDLAILLSWTDKSTSQVAHGKASTCS